MKLVTVSTLLEFLNQPGVNLDDIPLPSPMALNKPLWGNHTMLFRGLSDASYALETSLERADRDTPGMLRHFEEKLFQEIARRGAPYLDGRTFTPLQQMCLAQHHGIPTRLLDWTVNPLVALYFACERTDLKDCAVYKFNQPEWVDANTTEDPIGFDGIRAFRPPLTDPRYINQDAVLTVMARQIPEDKLTKYVFPGAAKADLRRHLHKIGIRPSVIFPGLDSIAKDIIIDCTEALRAAGVAASA